MSVSCFESFPNPCEGINWMQYPPSLHEIFTQWPKVKSKQKMVLRGTNSTFGTCCILVSLGEGMERFVDALWVDEYVNFLSCCEYSEQLSMTYVELT